MASTIPRPVSEVSLCMMNDWSKLELWSIGELVRVIFRAWNAYSALLDYLIWSDCPFLTRYKKGDARDEKFGTNL